MLSHDQTRGVGFWEKAHRGEGPFSSRPVRGACCHVTYTVDADLGHLTQVCLSGLSAVQLLPPSPLSSGRRSPCTPRTQGGGTLPSPPRGWSVCRTTWILPQSRFPLLPVSLSITYLCPFGPVGVYLAFGLESCATLFYCSDRSSFGQWEFVHWLLCPFDMPPSLSVCVCFVLFLSVSFLSGTARCSRLILCGSCPHPRNQEPGTFHQKMV